jgi:hypothetical protein
VAEEVDRTGWLHRDGGGFFLKGDDGAIWRLSLHRVPVDHIEKHVRIRGRRGDDGVLEIDGVSPA